MVDEHQGVFLYYIVFLHLKVLPFTCPVGSYNLKARLFNDTLYEFSSSRNNYGAKTSW